MTNRMMPYTESMDGFDGAPASSGEAMGLPNDVGGQGQRQRLQWLLRMLQQQGGVDPAMAAGAPGGAGGSVFVQPISWAGLEGQGGGGGGGLQGLMKMFGKGEGG